MALNHSYDYDHLQPYFYCDQEEEPTDPQLQPPVPSEDIWKKFQLLPTPPPTLGLGYTQRITCEAHRSHSFPKPIILRDCMWSSFSATPPLQGLNPRREPAGFQTPISSHLQDSDASAPESIDPTLIFPEVLKHSARMRHQPEAPPSGGGSCCTDSESDDEEDREEEGTVPKRQAGKGCGPQLFVLKRRHIFTKQHNYAFCPSSRHKQAAMKRLKLHVKPVQ